MNWDSIRSVVDEFDRRNSAVLAAATAQFATTEAIYQSAAERFAGEINSTHLALIRATSTEFSCVSRVTNLVEEVVLRQRAIEEALARTAEMYGPPADPVLSFRAPVIKATTSYSVARDEEFDEDERTIVRPELSRRVGFAPFDDEE